MKSFFKKQSDYGGSEEEGAVMVGGGWRSNNGRGQEARESDNGSRLNSCRSDGGREEGQEGDVVG